MAFDREFLTGTVGVLILSLLAEREMYGYEILREAERRSASAFQLKEGTLYPALLKLEQEGYIASAWGVSDNNRKAKYYKLTRAGRKQLEKEARDWEQATAILARFLAPKEQSS